MKIFEIVTQIGSGGAERLVVDLCNELAKDNEVTLISIYSFNEKSIYLKEIHQKINIISLRRNNKHLLNLLAPMFSLYHLIKTEKPDIVHTHLSAIEHTMLSWLTIRRIKFVQTIHSDAFKESEGGLHLIIRKLAFYYRLVVPVTISEASRLSFTKLYKRDSVLIRNGRPSYDFGNDVSGVKKELNSFKSTKDTYVLINVARINEVKNQLPLANAVKQLNLESHNVELVIIGAENDKQIASELKQIEHTHILGLKSNPRDYSKCGDAFVLTSVYEGMPITLIECFSVGTIPLCTPVGGIVNMIKDGENGLLADGTSMEDIKNLLKRFMSLSNEEKIRMKEASLNSFPSYSIEYCGKQYNRLFYQLANKIKDKINI